MWNPRVPSWMVLLGILAPLLLGAWLAAQSDQNYGGERRIAQAECKQNLHAIQLAIERYGVDHGYAYPLKLQAVVDEGYMPKWPRNPYSLGREPQPMQPVSPAQHAPGCFSYLPLLESPDAAAAAGYALLVYGNDVYARRHKREAARRRRDLPGGSEGEVSWPHVLAVLTSGYEAQAKRQREDDPQITVAP